MTSKTIESRYAAAKEQYAELGVDTDLALETLRRIPISIHCWQADDVGGFERPGAALDGGGIQATGNFPGKARTIDEARQDYEKVFSLLPGELRLNLHASYGEFPRFVDRDEIDVEHYLGWMDWAKDKGVKLDFNCTCFSHPKAESGFTLSSKDLDIRRFWIEHVRRCRAISAEMGRRQAGVCIHNVWIPDGSKDITVDRAGHRRILVESLDACFKTEYEPAHMKDAVESKLFGIGSEWYVVGSHEFYLGYALLRNKVICFDMGHYHPTESVADKISATLQFTDDLLLHLSRPIRWDSDHVVLFDDPVRDVAQELIRCGYGKNIYVALDFFDASINRVGAYVTGTRAAQQAFLYALLEPRKLLLDAEESGSGFERLALLEQCKLMPFGAVWDYYCETMDVPAGTAWIAEILAYENNVIRRRFPCP